MLQKVEIALDETNSGIHFAKYDIEQALKMLQDAQVSQAAIATNTYDFASLLKVAVTFVSELDVVVKETQVLEDLFYDVNENIEELTQVEKNNVLGMILLNTQLATRVRLTAKKFRQVICETIAVCQVLDALDFQLLDDCFVQAGLQEGMPEFFYAIFSNALMNIGREADAQLLKVSDQLSVELEEALNLIEDMIDSFYDDEDDYY